MSLLTLILIITFKYLFQNIILDYIFLIKFFYSMDIYVLLFKQLYQN